MPCRSGVCPVSSVACAVQVTAGSTSRSGRIQPAAASALQTRGERQQARRQTDGVDEQKGAMSKVCLGCMKR